MARNWTLTRTEGEFLDEVLLDYYKRTGNGMAQELGRELCDLFAMLEWEKRPTSPEGPKREGQG